MSFEIINNPHLPTGKVCHLLCGNISDELQRALLQFVDSLIFTAPEPAVEQALSCHADLSACPMPNKKILISKSQLNLKDKLNSLGFCVIMHDDVMSPYPKDCKLNFISTHQYSIFNSNILNSSIFHNSIKNITTKQGYIKCSVAPVASNAILTDDSSIAKAAEKQGIDVCFVTKGDILLPGYNYGFIGGCCGKLSESQLAFCGNVESHRDYKKIIDFLKRYNVTAINLSNSQLTDVGSLIPLTQKKG